MSGSKDGGSKRWKSSADPVLRSPCCLEKNARMRARILFSDRAGRRMDAFKGSERDWLMPSDRCWALAWRLGRTATHGRGPIGPPFATTRGGNRYLDPVTAARLASRANGLLPLYGLRIVSTRISKKTTWESSSRLIVVLYVHGAHSDEARRWRLNESDAAERGLRLARPSGLGQFPGPVRSPAAALVPRLRPRRRFD